MNKVIPAGLGFSTELADCDFETYCEAGFVWNGSKWECLPNASQGKKGLSVVGAARYAEHPTCDILSFKYDLKDGKGIRFWKPGFVPPLDLFEHVQSGKLIEAHNVGFERWVWTKVCTPKYGWPEVPMSQWRCSMAKAKAFALPGALDKAGTVLNLTHQKDKEGDRLLKKFSIPRDPTKDDKRTRIRPEDDPIDGEKLYAYNERDIVAEAELSSRVPDLEGEELEFWQCDQAINFRGVQIDIDAIDNAIVVIEQAYERYNAELFSLCGISSASKVKQIVEWLSSRGVHASSLDEDGVLEALKNDIPADARRVLEIRQAIGSASVKKLYAMKNSATLAGRLHDLFGYHAARTGRANGNGPQPQNLPNSGPGVFRCACCKKYFGAMHVQCPWCFEMISPDMEVEEWNSDAAQDAIETLKSRSLDLLLWVWGEAMPIVSSTLRGMFISAPGKDLICSDYSAIEGVVAAQLAGEEWRLEVFRTHGKIYEMSASKITGIPFEEFIEIKKRTGSHHPMRKKIGKPAELGSGFGGWIGAWKNFGADQFLSDQEIKDGIIAWRAASPAIVEMWGGQWRGLPWDRDRRQELFGLEGAFIAAVMSPGKAFSYRGISYLMHEDAVYCTLLSGRRLTYHRPRLGVSTRDTNSRSISYEGWNTNPKMGTPGWVRMETYGGKLFENVVQATARDLLAHAIVLLERKGYSVVLHVHDEIVAEVPEGWGSVEEFEQTMAEMPDWAKGWPIKAAGGFREKRYRK